MTTQSFTFKRNDFPPDFLFGTATSAYQIEGSGYGNAGRCHWDDFADTPGNVINGENGLTACNHYNLWQEDLDLVAKANLDAYRFSISWPRVIPNGVGQVNQQGLDFYDKLLDGILTRNLKPCLTLYHWELPSALSDLGGWRNRDIADWFTEYTEVVMSRLGDRLHSTATFNEPWCITWLSHFLGHHAPGMKDIRAAARSMHHVLLAHGKSIQVMRSLNVKNLGIVLNFEHSEPANNTPEAKAAALRYDGIFNRWFLEGLFNNSYPKDIERDLRPHLPDFYQDDFDIISEEIDWLGINYYTRALIDADPSTPYPSLKHVSGTLPKTAMDWEIYPEGLYSFLNRIHKDYTKGLPLYVTENGLALSDTLQNNTVEDPKRIEFIDAHVHAVKQAINEGVPVKGYFAWSLLDNYEWAFGYEKRFGMVYVDFDSFERTPKESFVALKKALG